MIREANRFKFRIGFLLMILLALLIPNSLEERCIVNASEYSSIEIDESLLKDGDIIFRRGISLVSNLVLEADSESPYSHVGIVSLIDGRPYVIHAVPDESPTGIDYVRKDSLQLFLRTDRASAYKVIRYFDINISGKASSISKEYYNNKFFFDDEFSLIDSSKLYCTELVWRAYRNAGVDITNNVRDTLTIPLGHNPYLLPGTILKSPGTTQVTKSSIFK